MEENLHKKKPKVAFIIIAVTVVIVIAIVAVIIGKTGSPEYKLKKQLEIADRYLSELKYEQAVASYQMALEIDPMCENAYLGMAEAYFGMGDTEAAFDILDAGIERIGSEALKARRTELEYRIGVGETHWHGGEWTNRDDVLPYMNDQGYMVFGAYEQDGDQSNGPEPIEWEIIEENEKGMFLISRYVIDCQPYNDVRTNVTWENCTLRAWLNEELYNIAFTAAEKEKIRMTDLKNNDNPYYGTQGGNDTQDRVFLLSVDEILDYYRFNSWGEEWLGGHSMQLMISATEYAKQQGVYTYQITQEFYNGDSSWWGLKGEKYSTSCIGFIGAVWWLRSPGNGYAVDVRDTGYSGWNSDCNTIYDEEGIRPAIYIEQ